MILPYLSHTFHSCFTTRYLHSDHNNNEIGHLKVRSGICHGKNRILEELKFFGVISFRVKNPAPSLWGNPPPHKDGAGVLPLGFLGNQILLSYGADAKRCLFQLRWETVDCFFPAIQAFHGCEICAGHEKASIIWKEKL